MRITRTDPPENLMRLGTHLEKQFFSRTELYDAILVNANVVEAFPAAIAALLASFPKPFVIDPITYGFVMPPTNLMRPTEDSTSGKRERKPKKSFLRLASTYVDIFRQRLESHKPTQLSDLADHETQRELCRNVLNFQRQRLMSSLEESEDAEYLPFSQGGLRPKVLLAPYFYMSDVEEGWFKLNIQLLEESIQIDQAETVYGMLCFDPELLDDRDQVRELATAYATLPTKGYFIWLSNFDESRASRTRIEGLIELLQILQPKPVYNAYGGYLSQLLVFFGMTGTCHGPGYGEFRNVLPVGGGVPTAQYYIAPLRQRLVYAEAQVIVPDAAKEFHANFCSCPTCLEVMNGDMENFERFGETETTTTERGKAYTYSTLESIGRCSSHYLFAKKNEFEEIRRCLAAGSASSIIASLRESAQWLEQRVGSFGVKHLRTWAEVLASTQH